MTGLNQTLPGAVNGFVRAAHAQPFVCSAKLPKGTVKGLLLSAAKKILLQDSAFEQATFGLTKSEKEYVAVFVREFREYESALKAIAEAGEAP